MVNHEIQEVKNQLAAGDIDFVKKNYAVEHPAGHESIIAVLIFSSDNSLIYDQPADFAFDSEDRDFIKNKISQSLEANQTLSFTTKNTNEPVIAKIEKLHDGNTIAVIKSTAGMANDLSHLRYLFMLATLAVALISTVVAYILGNKAMQPVRDLIRAVKKLERSSLPNEVSVKMNDVDLYELQDSFNHLLQKVNRLVKSLTEAFDHMAHDIRTPVTRLRGRAEMALAGADNNESLRDALQSCYENSDRILKFMENLSQITEAENRSINIKYELKSLGEMVVEMMDLYEIAFEEKNITVKQILIKNDKAYLDPNLIRRVIANLLDNAHKYTPEGGEVVIETYRTAKHVVLSVRDSGQGIPQQEQALIWNRLYRGDKSRSEQGMGLGLTLVKAVVEAHDGDVNVISPVRDGHGTEFLLKFQSGKPKDLT